MEKVRLEDNIMEKLRAQMTMDKATQYSKKVTGKIRRQGTELVSTAWRILQYWDFSAYVVENCGGKWHWNFVKLLWF